MLFDIYSFQDGSIISSKSVEVKCLDDVNVDLHFLNMHITRMHKYHHVPCSKTKIISEISGTTAKPHPQKGTGRARQGSKRSPHHRGGATLFGPRGEKRAISLPKKEVALAKRMLLAKSVETNKLTVVKSFEINDHKTKSTVSSIANFTGKRFLLLHDNEIQNNNLLSVRNLEHVHYSNISWFTVYDLMMADMVLITEQSMLKLSTVLKCLE